MSLPNSTKELIKIVVESYKQNYIAEGLNNTPSTQANDVIRIILHCANQINSFDSGWRDSKDQRAIIDNYHRILDEIISALTRHKPIEYWAEIKDRLLIIQYNLFNFNLDKENFYYEDVHLRLRSIEKSFEKLSANNFRIDLEKVKAELKNIESQTIDLNKSQIDFDAKVAKLHLSIREASISQEHIIQNIEHTNHTLNESLEKIQESFNNLYKEEYVSLISTIGELEKSASENIEEKLKLLNLTFEGFNNLISSKTTEELSKNYKDQRDYERNLYYFWNFAAICVLVISIGWTIFSVFSLSQIIETLAKDGKELIFANSQYIYWATRFIIGFLFLTLAILCSRVANKHYEYWRKTEDHFLKLASLRPYLAEMEKEQRINIHERLVDTYFGKDECKNNDSDIESLKDQIIDPIIQTVEKLVGKKSDSSD